MIDRGARVGVLYGGLSSERAISLKSGQAVLGALAARGWDVVGIDVGRDLPARLAEARVDVAWLALHGRYGEDGCVQGLLELLGLPYTGSGVAASAVAMDKALTKRVVAGLPDVALAADVVVRAGEPAPAMLRAGQAVILKPVDGGSTVGTRIVRHPSEWAEGLAVAAAESERVIVEEVVEGEEITVAVVDGDALPVVRIVPDSGFFDFAAKYEKGRTTYECPARLPDDVLRRAQRGAVAAFRAVGCRGLARADFIVRPDGVPVFLEINTIPGMTATSLSPMAAAATGLSFEDLVERLLLLARTDSRPA